MNLNFSSVGGTVTINGRNYTGQKISISGNRVLIDGKEQEGQLGTGPVTVNVSGDVASLHTVSGDVYVHGNAGSVQTVSGDVKCGTVAGSVNTLSGDIRRG